MTQNPALQSFLSRCEQWLCDDYSLDIRYIANETPAALEIFDAIIGLNPLPHSGDNRLLLSLPGLVAGQEQASNVSRDQLLALVREALSGSLTVRGQHLRLPSDGEYRLQPGVVSQSTWYMPLTLQVLGRAPSAPRDRMALDNALRASTPPFDGAEDLSRWLGLRLPDGSSVSSITLMVNPPVDMRLDRSELTGGILRLTLHAHPKADLSQIGLAVTAVPGEGLQGRLQVANRISWGEVVEGRIEGRLEVALPNAAGALVMLLVGSGTVRRNWFLDSTKAANRRFAAVQQFDSELRMIRQALFESTDSSRFEMGVAALLFLLGFAPAVQLETNSPDLIVVTPQGRLILVECTTRVADVVTKIGKLVDRRGALLKTLQADNQGVDVAAALVCRLPRDQIAAHTETIKAMGVILAAAEELSEGVLRARLPADPDDILARARGALMG